MVASDMYYKMIKHVLYQATNRYGLSTPGATNN